MNKKYSDIVSSEAEFAKQLADEVKAGISEIKNFFKNPENRDELNEPAPAFEAIKQDHAITLRDLSRRCVAHTATLQQYGPSARAGFEVLLKEGVQVPLSYGLRSDFESVSTSEAATNEDISSNSVLKLLPKATKSHGIEDASIDSFLPYWNVSLRGQWAREKEYAKGDMVYSLDNSNSGGVIQRVKCWFSAVRDLPSKSHKEPQQGSFEQSQWRLIDKDAAGPGFAEIDTDMALLICNYFSLEFGELKCCARESCKYIVLADVEGFDEHHEQMEELHNSIFATFLMTSAIASFLKNELESSPVAKLYILNCMKWLRETCTSLESYHAKLVSTVKRLTTFWPVAPPEQKRVQLAFLHGEAIMSGFFVQTAKYKKKTCATAISMTHPIQSILMYASCIYDYKFNMFDFNAKFKICFHDQHDDPLVIDTVNTSTNILLSKAINKIEAKSKILILARCIDPKIRLRPYLPIEFTIQKTKLPDMILKIPADINLYQARQLVIDYAFTYTASKTEVYDQGTAFRVKVAVRELFMSGKWEFVDNGDIINAEDETSMSAVNYAISQGCLEIVDGEQSMDLVFGFKPVDHSFFPEEFINDLKAL